MTYKTRQKDEILEFIRNQKGDFLVKDIYAFFHERIGLSTIYRMVDRLVLEGVLKKSINKNNVTSYQYLEECEEKNHFYLKCRCCGKMIHVDCDCICDFIDHISLKHQFMIDTNNIVLFGYCFKCQRRL